MGLPFVLSRGASQAEQRDSVVPGSNEVTSSFARFPLAKDNLSRGPTFTWDRGSFLRGFYSG
jgi:hypothetical protein